MLNFFLPDITLSHSNNWEILQSCDFKLYLKDIGLCLWSSVFISILIGTILPSACLLDAHLQCVFQIENYAYTLYRQPARENYLQRMRVSK